MHQELLEDVLVAARDVCVAQQLLLLGKIRLHRLRACARGRLRRRQVAAFASWALRPMRHARSSAPGQEVRGAISPGQRGPKSSRRGTPSSAETLLRELAVTADDASKPVTPVSGKKLLLHRPLPCNPAAETTLQPLIWCSESSSVQGCSSPEESIFQTPA